MQIEIDPWYVEQLEKLMEHRERNGIPRSTAKQAVHAAILSYLQTWKKELDPIEEKS